MEFNEKLQELRKNRGLTQEELAEALYVSRAAISKWESGRGYPNIDSIKEISNFFSVTIDDLLSSEKLLSIAEKENQTNIKNICNLLFGLVDICTFILILLPLYPNKVNNFVYSVKLINYTQTTILNRLIYWIMFILLILIGITKLILTKLNKEQLNQITTCLSILISILLILFLALAKEAYAIMIVFMLLIMKGLILLKYTRN